MTLILMTQQKLISLLIMSVYHICRSFPGRLRQDNRRRTTHNRKMEDGETLLESIKILVTFDIFHISYPYQNELTVLAKNFANVFIDMCWAHIVSPNASVNALLEWFDTVPLNKISAFGGDYLFVDGVYGHLKLAQQDVARALSIKAEGLFDMDKARDVAKMLFFDNPKNIFRLKI